MNQPTKEQILDAAKTSPEIKEALLKMYPEAFEDDINLFKLKVNECLDNKNNNVFMSDSIKNSGLNINYLINIRKGGEYEGKAFYLTDEVHWEMIHDNERFLCLVPTKK